MTDRPFRCFSCYKCFSDEATLRDHIPKHNETKHLKTKICPVCGKSYAQETYLARHMLRHQATPAAGASRALHPTLPPISVYTNQSAAGVSTRAYQPAVGSGYPQLPSGVPPPSGMQPAGFHAGFLQTYYTSGNQLN